MKMHNVDGDSKRQGNMMMRMMMAVMSVCVMGSLASAGTITKGTTAPASERVIASGVPDAPSFTRVFADGTRTSDYNEGRGNEIIADTNSLDGATMIALVVRKDVAQDFTGTTAYLTLYVFEGTKEMWDAGTGQNATDDAFTATGITNIYTETFALSAGGIGSYAEGDYVTLTLDTPITMTADMGFFIKMTQGDSSLTYFQIAQRNNDTPASIQDGYQYQAPSAGNLYTASPLEYYVVGHRAGPPDFVDDFPFSNGTDAFYNGTETPLPGWSYLYSPNSTIGTSSSYLPLEKCLVASPNEAAVPSPMWVLDGDYAFNDSNQGDGKFMRLGAQTIHPGSGLHHPIAAYTIQERDGAGSYAITNSLLRNTTATTDGVDLRVYVNDSLVHSLLNVNTYSGADTNFNATLGLLNVGDTVYVAYGPRNDIGADAGMIDFTIICESQGIPPPRGTVIAIW